MWILIYSFVQMNPLSQKLQQQSIRDKCYLKHIPRLEFNEKIATNQSICERFDEVVKRFPQNVAIKSRRSKLTYTELDGNCGVRYVEKPST